ncbi:MAG: hypothetical protein A2015_11730 [Spirochaetes bacterium GWF1_31_7]|nr:MAG: hypothetical protein A2Y30_15345 [Spirochaetes bacterium GWE1_32_154]OHD49088.1 MAG: hypothetical protein A2015_11730 [Spirochaetes bacterium GWF1_31_7]OHD77343.1 MAG: hypothetical protein A2355_14205 [Spirochaetes bacterium RIFOXYB1_FULL_32_8]
MNDSSENNLENIAKIAGVSIDVVRKVLSGNENIDPRVKDRILKIIHDKNYIGTTEMRNRKRGNYTHTTVGIIIPDINHNFWFEVIKGINDRLVIDKYNISIFNLARNQSDFYEYLVNERFAGIIIIGVAIPKRVIEMMNLTNTKFVFVDTCVEGSSSIYIDNKYGGELAAKHLIDKKAQHIAYIGHDEKHTIQDERLAGFKNYLSESGITDCIEKFVNLHNDDAYTITKKIVSENNVDGIFFFCDTLAYLGLTALKEIQKDIPIVGFDDMVMSELLGLTTIHQPAYEIGKKGAAELVRLITTDSKTPVQEVILPNIVKRRT